MPGGRPALMSYTQKIQVLRTLDIFDGENPKPMAHEVWKTAARLLGDLYSPTTLFLDVKKKRIAVPCPDSSESSSNDDDHPDNNSENGEERDRHSEEEQEAGEEYVDEIVDETDFFWGKNEEKNEQEKAETYHSPTYSFPDGDDEMKKSETDCLEKSKINDSDFDGHTRDDFSDRSEFERTRDCTDIVPETESDEDVQYEKSALFSGDNSTSSSMEPSMKRPKLTSEFLSHSYADRGRSDFPLQEVPVIIAGGTCFTMVGNSRTELTLKNTWTLDCLMQILFVAATDHKSFDELITTWASEEDIYMFIRNLRMNGLTPRGYQLRAMILQRVMPPSLVNDQMILDCQMHVATMAEKLMVFKPSYYELRRCSNAQCGSIATKPVVILTVAAEKVTDDSFKDILGNEIIPHIEGKSCTDCGGKAEIQKQKIGELVMIDVFNQDNSTMSLDKISKHIFDPLTTPPTRLNLIGVVKSRGSSGRLRSSSESFVHHTALVYRPGDHWIEYDSADALSVHRKLKKSQKHNIQLLVYAKIDLP